MSSNVIAGKKRKWSEITKADPSTLLHMKIHHSVKELKKAAKKAKGFEVQRLVKRMREARKSKDNERSKVDVVELESQLELLKKIDLERISGLSLASKIRKDKFLSSNELLLDTLRSFAFFTAQRSTDSQVQKVENRMLSSPVLASETTAAINGLIKSLRSHSDQERATTESQSGSDGEDEERTGLVPTNTTPHSLDEHTSQDDHVSNDGSADDDEDEEERLVEAAGWESGSIDDDVEEANSGDDVSIPSPKTPVKVSRSKQKTKPPETDLKSQFLPSLSVGYVPGDSDSEFNSGEEEPGPERKNRRGQRARQAIWAKKYGKNAKHIKKERGNVPSQGYVKDEKTRIRRDNQSQPFTPIRSHKPSVPSQAKPVETKVALHPSWEAKRMLKSKESARILPSQGKKIVFS